MSGKMYNSRQRVFKTRMLIHNVSSEVKSNPTNLSLLNCKINNFKIDLFGILLFSTVTLFTGLLLNTNLTQSYNISATPGHLVATFFMPACHM